METVGIVLVRNLSIGGLTLISSPTLAQTIDRPIEVFKVSQQITQTPTTKQQQPSPGDLRPPTPKPSRPPTTPKPPPPGNILKTPEIEKTSPLPASCRVNTQVQGSQTSEDTVTVKKFHVVGSTVFSDKHLEKFLKPCINKPLSFPELLQIRSAITQLYIDKGYVTTGAFIPDAQELPTTDAVVTIQVIEGRIEDIKINGTKRLNRNYVRSRLRLGTSTPLHRKKLLNALKLLQINPLIDSISAELRAGLESGTNVLEVEVKEAQTWSSQISLNNGRSPSVGSFRRGVGLTKANLLGLGDGLSVGYNNTDGSNGFDLSYTLPVNARDGYLNFSYGKTSGNIIEKPFDELDIESESQYYQLTYYQPIIQTPSKKFALSITASRNENQTFRNGIAEPISRGADREGRSKVSAIRFAQEWVQQSRGQVLAARSQFSLGIDALDSTINEISPDSRFFSWRGQFQWIRLFGMNTSSLPTVPTLFFRTDFQLADRPLLSPEQFGLGGFGSIRGYRQDALLTDNGVLASAELRFPVVNIPEWESVVQLIPFVDVGTGWNSGDSIEPEQDTLVSVGLGLQLINSNNFRARLDWGIPLVNLESEKKTWQENGVYFSVEYNPF
ncbi:MAG: ShlB/FhaC/HecB family hemolysin secretion/activation protein [Cyanobacteria bacterium J06639_18]